ncbi:hypothetical protein PENSPDRAFT_633596 [Peniophora sp. CONT]|nr:hypothetical protein PENSPDRAFT_633596 [Peniophora sp. CONT]
MAYPGDTEPGLDSSEAYKRSVMLVIWYKARTAPLRVVNPLPSFPYLSLAQFPHLVAALSLSTQSFVDAYNPRARHWEQHTLSTVRVVATEQRILYRLRQSLLEGLEEDECPGLAEELEAQERFQASGNGHAHDSQHMGYPGAHGIKRQADAPPDEDRPSKYYVAESGAYPAPPAPPTPVTAHNLHDTYGIPTPSFTTPGKDISDVEKVQQGAYVYDTSLYSAVAHSPQPPTPSSGHHQGHGTPSHTHPQSSPQMQSMPQPPSTPLPRDGMDHPGNPPTPAASPLHVPIPYHPHPPLKRWPNDYTVNEIATGFSNMDALIGAQPTLTQKVAFERVFGCRYVKSTVCRHRGVWRRADAAVRNAFVAMGRAETAVWGEFVRRVEGRASALPDHGASLNNMTNLPPGDNGSIVPVVSSSTTSVPVSVQVEHSQDPMGSIAHELAGVVSGAHHRGLPTNNVYETRHGGPSISNALGGDS